MLIAFEGPDKTGKSTSATNLSASKPIYNATKVNHALAQLELAGENGVVQCFDRIDWLTHMVYRLALPNHEWNDNRIRTVFAMPDTHLVFKLHKQDLAADISDELYQIGTLSTVNTMYASVAKWLLDLNEQRDWSLFKTVTILEVINTGDYFASRMVYFSSPVFKYNDAAKNIVCDDQSLLELLEYADSQRL